MADAQSSQTEKQPSEKTDHTEDMAALLFAELFHKQVMAEREEKRRLQHNERIFDNHPK